MVQFPTPNSNFRTFSSHSLSMVVVQSLSHVQLFAIPWTTARQASLSFTISQSLLKLILAQLNFSASSPEGSVLRQVVWFSSLRFQLWQMSCSYGESIVYIYGCYLKELKKVAYTMFILYFTNDSYPFFKTGQNPKFQCNTL